MSEARTLPDFSSPPLDEVILGVQFEQIPAFQTLHASEVWDLFRAELPGMEEQPPIPPQFETFGGPTSPSNFRIQLRPMIAGSRFWFISSDENHLVQFQSDRFILNWRKRRNTDDYPRFEFIIESFVTKFNQLSQWCQNRFGSPLVINQAEISYINIIKDVDFSSAGDWLNILDLSDFGVEGLSLNFIENLSPRGVEARLYHELDSAFSADGEISALRLNLTFRGKPEGEGIDEAYKFISQGREEIVNRFANLTTSEAQKIWGRKQ